MRFRRVLLAVALLGGALADAGAQERPELRLLIEGRDVSVPLHTERGFAAVPASEIANLGWEVEVTSQGVVLDAGAGILVTVWDGTPFFEWDAQVLQLADAPYVEGGELLVPVQLLTDFLPHRGPGEWTFDGGSMTLRAGSLPRGARPAEDDGIRVVVIDAGHGGKDPGTLSGSLREKNVALGISLALAAELRKVPFLEVHLVRDSDTFVPPWDRGPMANEWKGERPGVFLSIHANSAPNNRSARGFETYFLSEARTEHERRVAALENAPFQRATEDLGAGDDLGFILRELATLDHQHWSSLLAELIQEEVAHIHPGPNRGVKQGVLAVLTNSLMPGVLVEIGYLSHAEEGRVLTQVGFQQDAARSIAQAVERFFQRYPPGTASGGDEER